MLRALELNVFLGWLDTERENRQAVSLDIHLQFSQPPLACASDNLSDTVCYDSLITEIKNHLGTRHFRLLEHLGCEIYQVIKQNLAASTSVNICITKKPAITDLNGGAAFYYGDGDVAW